MNKGLLLLFLTVVAMPLNAVQKEESAQLSLVEVESVASLEQIFQQVDFQWPPSTDDVVPHILLKRLPQDLAEVQVVDRKKSLFLRALLPVVLLENRRLREQRQLMKLVLAGQRPASGTPLNDWVLSMAKRYAVKDPYNDSDVLLRRLDVVPHGLVLAQAAIETGWGSSRFLHEGNSLFGQWTWSGEGIVPEGRDEGLNHRVKSFSALHMAVRSYLHNLNTGSAYTDLRLLRESMRDSGARLDPVALASGLSRYSQRGEDYVDEVRTILHSNHLVKLNQLVLDGGPS